VDRKTILDDLQLAANEVLGEDAPTLEERLSLGDDAELDSLGLIEMSMIIEERYEIAFEPAELEGLTTIADVVDVIAAKMGVS